MSSGISTLLNLIAELSTRGSILLVPPHVFESFTGSLSSKETFPLWGRLHLYPFRLLEDEVVPIIFEGASPGAMPMSEEDALSMYKKHIEGQFDWTDFRVEEVIKKMSPKMVEVLDLVLEGSCGEKPKGLSRTLQALLRRDLVVGPTAICDHWRLTNKGFWVWQETREDVQLQWPPGTILEATEELQLDGDVIPKGAQALVVRNNHSLTVDVMTYIYFQDTNDLETNVRTKVACVPIYDASLFKDLADKFEIVSIMEGEPSLGSLMN